MHYKGILCVSSIHSCIQLFVTLWTVVCQAPLSMGIFQAKILEWVANVNEYWLLLPVLKVLGDLNFVVYVCT